MIRYNKKTIVIGIVITIILVVTGFKIYNYQQIIKQEKQKELSYVQAVNYIDSENWDLATTSLYEVYKYEDMINTGMAMEVYIGLKKELNLKKAENLYVEQIDNKIQLLEGYYSFSGKFQEHIRAYIDELTKIRDNKINLGNQKKEKKYQEDRQKSIEKITNDSIKMIQEGNYEEAIDGLILIYNENEELETIYNYARSLSYYKNNNFEPIVSEFNPDYSGELAQEIKKFILKFTTLENWRTEYEASVEAERKVNERNKKPLPEIGMTSDEIRNSRWGNPDHINKTTTKYGKNEQWVYSGNKYVYLENGVVTAIQE